MTYQELRESQISNLQYHLDNNIKEETIVASYSVQALIRSLVTMLDDREFHNVFHEKIEMKRPEDV